MKNDALDAEQVAGPHTPTNAVQPKEDTPTVGKYVPGYVIPVINERAVRASAGILFLLGVIAWGTAYATGSIAPMRPFGFLFVIDMGIRVGLGDKWSPSMILGRLAVMGQKPEWVGASQKVFAWWLGFGMAATFCAVTGYLNSPVWVALTLCGFCLGLLFLETAFGICLGCHLQRIFSKTDPMYCPGGVCDTP